MAESRASEQQGTGQGQSTSQGLQTRRANLAPREQFGMLTPFSFMRRFTEDMDRLLSSIGRPFDLTGDVEAGELTWTPSIEMFQRDSELVVRAELPGMKKDDVKVEIDDDVLIIEGERRQEREEHRGGVYHSERSYGRFSRAIPLPEGAIPESAKAAFKDGVLEITVQTPPSDTRKKQQVQIEDASNSSGPAGK